jgi:hydroxylamine reductase
MFCHQCQEAAKGVGCSIVGVCGKKEDVSNLQDLLLYSLKGIAIFRSLADENFRKENGEHCDQLDRFIVESLFMTITNANFDKNVFVNQIKEALDIREKLKAKAKELGFTDIKFSKHDAANFIVETEEEMEAKAISIGWLSVENEDIRSLQSLILYGVKGMAAYYEHAVNLGKKKKDLVMFMEKALLATIDSSLSVDDLVALTMETGKYSVDVMALLDEANTSTYGNPEITEVNIGVKKNPGILISGHDLKDLEMLLEQTKGTGIDVYTHGEMLPANYYPFFKKYDNLVGNYGNAWWQQKSEMEAFNGPILFTTNCIVPPSETYKDRVYTTGASGFEGCTHFEADENGH